MSTRLLFLDPTRLATYRWRAGHLHAEEAFSPDAAGIEAFGEYAKSHRTSLFYILADIAEEGFQIEDVPFAQGSDRNALFRRKLAQYFYGTPYTLAISLGRRKDGRRDERMLFAALTRPLHIEPWLTALREVEAQLAGIYSVPLVVPPLLPLIAQPGERFVLVTLTRGGLRQTFYDNGQIGFSRLTTLATGAIEEVALACAAESERMVQYLTGQRLISRGTQLSTRVLMHPDQGNAIRQVCVDTGSVHFEFIDLINLSSKVGLKTPPINSSADPLFLHLMAQRPPPEQFAPPAERHFFRLGQLRQGLRAGGAIVFGACLLFAGRQGVEYQSILIRTADTAAQAAADKARYDSILNNLPKIPLGNDDLRALIGRYDHLLERSVGPEPMYLALSRVLDASPGIEITRLNWTLGAGKEDKNTLPSPPQQPGSLAPPPNQAAAVVDSVEIQARLPLGLASDQRAQLTAIEDFAAALRTAQMQVRITKQPFEAQSDKALKSGAEAATQAQAPQFTLRAIRSIP